MKCPICGAKLYKKEICKYCKITNQEILSASNKKVKQYRKTDRKDLIVYTNVIPSDVNKIALWILTILLGWSGVNQFVVYRNVRGAFSLLATILSLGILILRLSISPVTQAGAFVVQLFYELFFLMMAINVIMWIFDIFGLIFRSFKVPVVMPEGE